MPDAQNSSSSRFPNNLPSVWREHLSQEGNEEYFKKLVQFLKTEYTGRSKIFPTQENVLRALQNLDYPKVRVVVLGQDPYHGVGQAIGKCFAVPNSLKPKPPSLLNIFKEIESDLGKKVNFENSELSHWVSQGVLLLNTVLTVRESQPLSHREKGWEIFTDKIIRLLNEREAPIIFILWGSPARKKKELITNSQHYVLESAHPSPLSSHRGFFGSRPFSKSNAILKKLGQPPINWEITS